MDRDTDSELPTDLNRMAWEHCGFTLQLWSPYEYGKLSCYMMGLMQVIGDHKTAHPLEKAVPSRVLALERLFQRDLAFARTEIAMNFMGATVNARRLWSMRIPYIGPLNDMTLCVLRMTALAELFSDHVRVARTVNPGMAQLAYIEQLDMHDWTRL